MSVDVIDTTRMPAARAARICRRLGRNPGTELGAELQGMSHPFSWSDFAIADLHVSASKGLADPHWSKPDVKSKSTEQVAAEWNTNYARFKAKRKGAQDG